jgi:DNA-binding NarL/FixJ family response regulator
MRTQSPRQRAVAKLLLKGYAQQEIAKELGIALRTVKDHLRRLYMIYHVTDRYVKRVRLVYLLSQEQGERDGHFTA